MITEEELADRVEFWQSRLDDLGVMHWRVQNVLIKDTTPGGDSAAASVWFSSTYDTCEFYFQRVYLEDVDQERLDETIIHEWLHVAWRDLDTAVESAEKWFTEAAWEDFQARFNHEREGAIERTARALYVSYRAEY